ncbi:SDR family oxidoreductase [Spirosoma sp.]|uniref:SDR family oxidoreductase n=1 Tax=Spirosoma sp. TaxID=1899569 RepID=UPI003B3ABB44
MSFSNSVIWITGASSGIGEAIAIELAKGQNVKLILSARNEEALQQVAERTTLPASNVLVLPMDMREVRSMNEHVAQVLQQFNRIDYVFQNAGVTQRSSVVETDLAVYQQLMDINFLGAVALTKAVLPHMLTQKSGHFVVTSSVAGKLGTKQRSGYCASKHALHGFFDSLRAETYHAGLRVTMACPGYIRTDISMNALDASGRKHGKMDENQLNGIRPEEYAEKLLRAVSQQKEEVYIGGREIAGIYLKRFLPGVLSRLLRNRDAT